MSFLDINGRINVDIENGEKTKLLVKKGFENCLDDLQRVCSEYAILMEHSYSRDSRPIEGANGLTTRTLMIHKPPQCPSCHIHPTDEGIDLDEANHPPIPSYNENAAKESMNECSKAANSVRNSNSEDQDWEEKINKTGWTHIQERLFSRVARVLDLDHLARLATIGRQHEPVQRRVIIDKSVQRMRQALASVSWEPRWTQWIHGLLMDSLSASYMASYLDILQTMKTKLPSLMEKMLFGKPMNTNQDLLTPVLKKQWDPIVCQKNRKLPGNPAILIIPSSPTNGTITSRMQKWMQLLSTMGQIIQVNVSTNGTSLNKQPVEQVAEHIIFISRLKIQELRNELTTRHIILVGFNAGATLAMQLALVENVNSVVCIGFAYNTVNGVRGAPDDHILDITTPVIFVIGQNSAKTSQEEMESLREKMQSETGLVVVGSADDSLRVPKNRRQIEGVTQSMVDNMITDEVFEFARNCIVSPPGPRQPTSNVTAATTLSNLSQNRRIVPNISTPATANFVQRKRKVSHGSDSEGLPPAKSKFNQTNARQSLAKFMNNQEPFTVKRKVGRPRTRPLPGITSNKPILSQPTTEVLNMAIQSILPEIEKPGMKNQDQEISPIVSTYEIIAQPKLEIRSTTTGPTISNSVVLPIVQRSNQTNQGIQKIKMVQQNQFIHLKSQSQTTNNAHKIYTIKTAPMVTGPSTHPAAVSDNSLRGSQIFTVKSTPSGAQFMPTSLAQSQLLLNPQKFTVLKTGTTMLNTGNVGVEHNKLTNSTDLSNIFDMPIIFADNDGNIHDTAPISSGIPVTTSSPIIITQSQINELSQSTNKNFVINNVIQKPKTANKVVYINRNAMKPCPNILSKSVPPLKYTKVVVTNPKTSTASIVSRSTSGVGGGVTEIDNKHQMTTITIQKPKPGDMQSGSIIKTSNIMTQQQSSGILTNVSSANKQYPPIIINVDSDKTTIKNMIKVGDSQMKPIILKPGGLKPIPVLKPAILNRNLTVRKVVNLVPQPKTQIMGSAAGEHNNRTVVSTTTTGQIVAVSTTASEIHKM